MGAELNAGTGKETTSVYARVIDEHLADAFDVMADMVFRPALTEIDSEREVILEEIAMYEDDPQEKVFDLLGEAMFGADPLGRAIIGRAEVISGTPARRDRRASIAERYRPATSSSRPPARSTTTRSSRWPPSACPADRRLVSPARRPARAPRPTAARRRFERKDTEQFHVCLGGLGLSRHDDRRFALRVLDTIFGGTSSSRLFQEVRERARAGLCGLLVHQRATGHRPGRPVRRHPGGQPGPGAGASSAPSSPGYARARRPPRS